MKWLSDNKFNADGSIFSNKIITEKDGYKTMLYMLEAYLELTDSDDIVDILGGGSYLVKDTPGDSAFWEYWLDAVERVKKEGFLPIKINSCKIITEKEGYEAMLYMLDAYWELNHSGRITDVLYGEKDTLGNNIFREYWLKAVEKVKKEGSPPIEELR